ncbi:MAG: alkaline phosphatase family protein [Caldilineaceae bacterium]
MTAVLIMTDGMRPDALPQVDTPHLDALQARSAYTMAGSSVMPSVTLPCHTSIFHSVPPQRHGIVTNVWQPMARPLPGLVTRPTLRQAAAISTIQLGAAARSQPAGDAGIFVLPQQLLHARR